jgi:undecaprenyl-diphosphatase
VNWTAAVLLGVVQGLTEFLPVSSTAHLLLGARFLGFDDPGGLFTVMIQLGSILAIVWLYRAKIVRVLAGLTSDPEARHFVLMIGVAFVPAAIAGALFSDFVKRVLYTTPAVIAVASSPAASCMLVVERYGRATVVERGPHLAVARARHRRVPDAGADSRRVALRRDHRRRDGCSASIARPRRSSRSSSRSRRSAAALRTTC